MKSHSFDMTLTWEGESIQAVGSIDPGEAATGPTYDCGGTPGCPAMVDEVQFFAEDGSEIEDPDGKILAALEDTIMERAGEDAEGDEQDAAEARADARRENV
jgi:hypothetical protein